jgi:hypothetical protein
MGSQSLAEDWEREATQSPRVVGDGGRGTAHPDWDQWTCQMTPLGAGTTSPPPGWLRLLHPCVVRSDSGIVERPSGQYFMREGFPSGQGGVAISLTPCSGQVSLSHLARMKAVSPTENVVT